MVQLREVQTGNLGPKNLLLHGMGGNGTVESIAIDKDGLPGRAAMSLEHIDSLDGVLVATLAIRGLDGHGGVHHHVGKEVIVDGDYFGGHGGSGSSNNAFPAKIFGGDCEVVLDVPTCFLASQLVASND